MVDFIKVLLWIAAFAVLFFTNLMAFWLGMLLCFVYLVYKAIPLIYSIRANAMFSEGRYRKAAELYKKANKRDNTKFNLRYYYACALMRTGDFDEAEAILNGVIRDKKRIKEADKNTARMQRCMVYLRQGRKAEAIESATELFESGYKNSNMYAMIGYFKIMSNEPQKSVTAFCEEAYEYNNEHRDIMDNLSICYMREGRYAEAKELSDKLMELSPTFVEAFYHGAEIALKCNDYDRARELAKGIDSCHMSAMTTVSREEIRELKRRVGLTNQE